MTASRSSLRACLLIALTLLPLTVLACAASVDDTIDDATITAHVKTAILNDRQIGAMKIDVDTTGGVVALSGIVKSQGDATRAVQLAKQAPGVKDVKSTLQIQP